MSSESPRAVPEGRNFGTHIEGAVFITHTNVCVHHRSDCSGISPTTTHLLVPTGARRLVTVACARALMFALASIENLCENPLSTANLALQPPPPPPLRMKRQICALITHNIHAGPRRPNLSSIFRHLIMTRKRQKLDSVVASPTTAQAWNLEAIGEFKLHSRLRQLEPSCPSSSRHPPQATFSPVRLLAFCSSPPPWSSPRPVRWRTPLRFSPPCGLNT